MRLLVTGADGFVGREMLDAAAGGRFPGWNIVPLPAVDVVDAEALGTALRELRFDALLHLAAQTHVPTSFANPRATFEVNLFGTLNLLTALRAEHFAGRILYVSSGDVYGAVDSRALPITEANVPRPRSPYAVSKLAAEALACQFALVGDLDVVVARPFNHVGPGQSTRFAVASLARQVAEIRIGRRPPRIEAGNLESARDFSDVDDVLAAYLALLERGRGGEVYNVCSGTSRTLREVLTMLQEIAGVRAEVQTDPTLLRSGEQTMVAASNAKLRQDTGWSPSTPFTQTLRNMLAYWESGHG